MDPKKYLQDLHRTNPDLFNDMENLREHLRMNSVYRFPNISTLQKVVDGIDFDATQEQEPEKKKDVLSAATEFPSTGEVEGPLSELESRKRNRKVGNILNFIGDKESNNDPNRFRGDVELGQMNQFKFENMSIGEVLSWQENNKDEKGRYRAVGRFQFMPDTLREFMKKSGLSEGDQFSSENQDLLTIKMLEEGGLKEFLDDPNTNKDKILETISRRFASMPLTKNQNVNGRLKKRGESRYGGLNKALVSAEQLENALDVIPDLINFKEGKNAKEYYQDLEEQLQSRKPFGGITTKFLQDQANAFGISGEREIKTELERVYGHMGFQFEEAGFTGNEIIIVAPNGERSEAIALPGYLDAVQDLARTKFGGEDKSKGEVESGFTEAARKMRSFMGSNYADPVTEYINKFQFRPIDTAQEIFNKYVTVTPEFLDSTAMEITALEMEQQNIDKFQKSAPGTQSYGQVNPEWQKIEDQIRNKRKLYQTREDQKKFASTMIINLLEEMGGVEFFEENIEHGTEYIAHMVNTGLIDMDDMPIKGIMIDDQPASYNLLNNMLTDFSMRQAYHDGQFTIELDESQIGGKSDYIRDLQRDAIKKSEVLFEKYTRDGTFFGKDGLLMFGMNQMVTPLLASGLELMTNAAAGLQDILMTPAREINRFYLEQNLLESDDSMLDGVSYYTNKQNREAIDSFIETMYNPRYQKGYQYMRDEIRKLRDEIPVSQGGIGESASVREAFTKGGAAASESIPLMTMYFLAPEFALATTGVSVYGDNMQNYQDMMQLAQDMDLTDAKFLMPGYEDLTLGRARALSVGKGLSEALITRAFTYNYVKGLGTATKSARGASMQEMKNLVKDYRKSFISKTLDYNKALSVEAIEENLITIDQMFIDDVNGIEEYNFQDYASAVKETTLSTLFTSAPMTAMASKKRSRVADAFVRKYVSERFVQTSNKDRETIQSFNVLDALIQTKGEDNVSQQTIEARDQLAKDIMTTYQEKQDLLLKHASDSDLRQLVTKDIEIQELGRQYRQATTDIEKQTIKLQVEKRYDDFTTTLRKFDQETILRTQTELESLVLQKANKDKEDEQRVEREVAPAETQFEAAIRAASNSLHTIASELSSNREDTSIFRRRAEDVDELISYLDTVKEGDLSDADTKSLTKFMEAFSGTKEFLENTETAFNRGTFDLPKTAALGRLVSDFVTRKKYTDAIRKAFPAGFEGKIDPFTRLESYSITPLKLAGLKEGALSTATVDHMIKILLKNDQMSQPLTELSNKIDVGMAKAQVEAQRRKSEYNELSFLGKVNKRTKEEYFTRENEIERGMLAFLQKDVEGQDNYLQKKKSLKEHLEDMVYTASTTDAREEAQQHLDIFNRVVMPSPTAEGLNATAKKMNVKGVEYLREMFQVLNEGNRVVNHMADNLGREATMFTNYVPTVFQRRNDSNEYMSNDQVLMDPESPGAMEETSDQTSIPKGSKLVMTNFDNVMFNSFENSLGHLDTYGDMRAYEAILNSKEFASLFDTSLEFRHGLGDRKNKFDYIKDLLLKKTSRIKQRQRSVHPSVIEKDLAQSFVNLTTKIAATRRLAEISMPLKQGFSAMFGQIPTVGNEARSFLIGRIARFGNPGSLTGKGGARHLSESQSKILSESLTQTRGGLAELQTDRVDELKYAKVPVFGKVGKGIGKLAKTAESIADAQMNYLLAHSDKIAGQNTFLALYMDYDLKNNPEARKIASDITFLDSSAYWKWAEKNINRNAIAYADQQVDRSQTQTAPWNLGGAFGSNKGQGDMPKMLSQVLFLFGRFAYNRKVGVANDISILSSDIASSQDKSAATRRLASAAIEIGVFKAISPTVGLIMTEIFAGAIGALLGVDEELDKQIKSMQKMGFGEKAVLSERERSRFYTSNYKRNVSKEFGTALVDGFIPVPTPPVLNQLGMAAINGSLNYLGVTDDDVFNLYGPSFRALSSGNISPISEQEVASFILNNSGIGEITTQDYTNAIKDLIWIQSQSMTGEGKVSGFMGFGPDRRVTDQALQAQKLLVTLNLLNFTFVPSADLNRFQRQLRGVIRRDFTTTRKVE